VRAKHGGGLNPSAFNGGCSSYNYDDVSCLQTQRAASQSYGKCSTSWYSVSGGCSSHIYSEVSKGHSGQDLEAVGSAAHPGVA
jgi:hypothetical protein